MPDTAPDPRLSLLKDSGDAHQTILRACSALENIAYSLGRVGLDRIADEVGIIAEDIQDANKRIQGNVSEDLHIRNKEATRFNAEILKALLDNVSGGET